MAGIRINKIVDASPQYEKWGERVDKGITRETVVKRLPYPLRALRGLPGPAKALVEGIVSNAPENRYLVKDTKSKTHDPVIPMIRTAVEMLFSEQVPDGSRCYRPEDFDAMVITGAPFRAGEPSPMLRVMKDLDANHVISEKQMLGKSPHTNPWYIDVLSEGCVSWVKTLRRVEDLMDSGKIKSAIVVSFGRPTFYMDPHKLYEFSNHADGATACVVVPSEGHTPQIQFGEKSKKLNGSSDENGNGNGHIEANGNGKAAKKHSEVLHNYDVEPLDFLEQWSFFPSTCLEGLDDSQSSSDFIASQCAKSLIEMAEKRGVPLDQFDAILLPQVSETFLDKVETELGTAFRKKLKVSFHIRDELKQIVRAYCASFNEYLVKTGKRRDQTCRHFCEVLKESEKPESNGGLYQLFLSKLTPDETTLFDFMRNIRSKNFRTYESVGYTTSNSIPGGLALGVQSGRFSLDNSFAIASGALGYSFDGLTMNAPSEVSPGNISTAETVVDIPAPARGWTNRVRSALRAIGLQKVFPAL